MWTDYQVLVVVIIACSLTFAISNVGWGYRALGFVSLAEAQESVIEKQSAIIKDKEKSIHELGKMLRLHTEASGVLGYQKVSAIVNQLGYVAKSGLFGKREVDLILAIRHAVLGLSLTPFNDKKALLELISKKMKIDQPLAPNDRPLSPAERNE